MAPIVFGLLAALSWGVSAVVGGQLVRLVGTWAALGATMVMGLVLVLPLLLAVDRPDASPASWGYGVASGICYVSAVACWLAAVRNGKVSLVTPIVSTDGAMAALIAVAAFDETLGAGVAVALAVIVAGVVTASIRGDAGRGGRFTGRELGFALGAAGLFGFTFVASGQAEDGLGVVWTLVVSRVTAVAVALPLALAVGALRLPRRALPFALAMAALDMAGFAAFLGGVSGSVAITSVLASQYAIVAVVGSYLVLGERLSRLQTAGVALTLVGVAALAALQA